MTTTQTAPAGPSAARPRPLPRWLLVGGGVVLAASLALRFIATSPLWLDEAQTVAIAHRNLSGLFSALRVDGSPPLYYLLLHFWMAAFGTSTVAVRVLPGLLSAACLPAAYLAARRLGLGRDVGWAALLVVATSPFAIAYATQTRMYALELLLALLAVPAYERVWRVGSWWHVALAGLVTAALLLTHYWSLFFYAVGWLVALWFAVRRGSRPARRVVGALLLAAVPFAPWAPTFVFQTRHTGAPWGTPPGVDTVLLLPLSWSGAGLTGKLLAGAFYLLVAAALWGRVTGGLLFRRPARPVPLLLVGLGGGGVLLACVIGAVLGSAYATRYSTLAFAPFVLLVAAGVGVLPARRRPAAVAVLCVLGLVGSVGEPGQRRTQADEVVAAMRPAPGDVVAFCPDQLGPAVHRLAPDAGRQVTYPDLKAPTMVNWVDYKDRIENSRPYDFARRVLALSQGRPIYLVYATDYKLYGDKCSAVAQQLAIARGMPRLLVRQDTDLLEHEWLAAFPAAH